PALDLPQDVAVRQTWSPWSIARRDERHRGHAGVARYLRLLGHRHVYGVSTDQRAPLVRPRLGAETKPAAHAAAPAPAHVTLGPGRPGDAEARQADVVEASGGDGVAEANDRQGAGGGPVARGDRLVLGTALLAQRGLVLGQLRRGLLGCDLDGGQIHGSLLSGRHSGQRRTALLAHVDIGPSVTATRCTPHAVIRCTFPGRCSVLSAWSSMPTVSGEWAGQPGRPICSAMRHA